MVYAVKPSKNGVPLHQNKRLSVRQTLFLNEHTLNKN